MKKIDEECRSVIHIRQLYKKNNENGITLIALVVTIIVLLILAGVSIAMLTGQNGILTQAQNAKQETDRSAEQEKIQIAVNGSRNDEGQLSFEKLKTEIENQNGKVLGDSIPTTVELNNNLYRVNSNGEVTKRIAGGTLETVTGTETTNTTVQDALGNQVVVPAGFKIVNSNDYVTDGIVIEDESYEATKGSQFVWIPVGDVKKEDNTTVNIKLSRYTFDENGKETEQGSNVISNYFTEINTSTYGNTTAKENIESEDSGFRKSAIDNHGYYIGRYEARTNIKRTTWASDEELTQITEKPEEFIYNCVSQPQAAKLSREMYSNNNFKSDLVNSYAWDTAILFLQNFDNRVNRISLYSILNSINSNFAEQGTNNLEVKNEQDIICNIWDMSSNCYEWSTEACSYPNCGNTYRGGMFKRKKYYTSTRFGEVLDTKGYDISFRTILYL